MISFFKTTKPIAFVFLLLYAVIIFLNGFINTIPVFKLASNAPFSNAIYYMMHFLHINTPFKIHYTFIFISIIQALYLNKIITNHKIFEKDTLITASIYLLLLALLSPYLYWSPAFLAVLPMLLALNKIYDNYHVRSALLVFDIGFYTAIATLFYLPTIVFIPFIFIGLSVIGVFNLKDWLLSLLGVITVYFLTGVYFLWNNQLLSFIDGYFLTKVFNAYTVNIFDNKLLITIGSIFILLAISIIYSQSQFLKSVVKVRLFLSVFLYFLVISLVGFIFLNKPSLEPAAIMLIPTSVFISHYWQNIKGIYADMLFLLLLLLLIFNQYISKFIL